MPFFSRRRAFLLIEDKGSQELTKKFFVGKILFLQKQYKLSFNSLQSNTDILPEFSFNSLFIFDWGYKILSIFKHLADSSEIEWIFLNSFTQTDARIYALGEVKSDVKFLKTDFICGDSNWFFLRLLKMKILNASFWFNMCLLKQQQEILGLSGIHDHSYYEAKSRSLISFPENLNSFNLKEDEVNFSSFLGSPLVLNKIEPVCWFLLVSLKDEEQSKKCASIISSSSYLYENIRKNPESKKFLDNVVDSLFVALDRLNCLDNIYVVSEEFSLFGRFRNLFNTIFLFFLSQKSMIFDVNNLCYVNRSRTEKFASALKFLGLISFICDFQEKIDLTFSEISKSNFLSLCEIELGVLRDSNLVNYFFVSNFSQFVFIFEIVKKIKESKSYSSFYSKYLSQYFENF